VDPELLASFAVDGKSPRSVVVVRVVEVYFQCARALMRSELWNPTKHVDPANLPTAGEMIACVSEGRAGGAEYDRTWAERAKATLW
jgi:uncharacterized protein